MLSAKELANTLRRIDGRGYKAYLDIRGSYDFPQYQLQIDYVQGDPFAPPSRVRVTLSQKLAQFPEDLFHNPSREMALEDYLARAFYRAADKISQGRRGTGKSGLLTMARCGQQVLQRTAVEVGKDQVEARFFMGLPAHGRRIAGAEADQMFFQELPQIVQESLLYASLEADAVQRQVEVVEDADFVRSQLREQGLTAFVANDSILPRATGVSDRPLEEGAIAFRSPPSLEVTFSPPNCGSITGMGIPEGIALVVGGGYHGKSTLLNAIADGVYDHIPGDGREFVVTVADAMKIRAEDGRYVEKVDISPFIANLPFGRDTTSFSTLNASGSTSQAANIIEALEAGARFLLIDEDTSATNFMIRDERMQALVAKEKEPITPLVDTIKLLNRDLGVSCLLVMGGSGDYFDVADTVIMLDSYVAKDVTQEARAVIEQHETRRQQEASRGFQQMQERVPLARSFDARRGRKIKVSPDGRQGINFGREYIDLSAVEQLAEDTQTRSIGWLIHYAAENLFDGKRTLAQALDALEEKMDREGLMSLMPFVAGDSGRPRRFEIAAAINRLRTLKCS